LETSPWGGAVERMECRRAGCLGWRCLHPPFPPRHPLLCMPHSPMQWQIQDSCRNEEIFPTPALAIYPPHCGGACRSLPSVPPLWSPLAGGVPILLGILIQQIATRELADSSDKMPAMHGRGGTCLFDERRRVGSCHQFPIPRPDEWRLGCVVPQSAEGT
jgi:hypothetical protein